MLVNKSASHQRAAKSTSNESELDLPEDILEPSPLIAIRPSDELLAIKLTIPSSPSTEPTGSAVLPPAPEANEPPIPTATDLIIADKLLDTTTIPMLHENTLPHPEVASEPASDDIVQPLPLIDRNPSAESLAVAPITPPTSSTESTDNTVPPPEADAPIFPAIDDPALTDNSPDTPDIPGVVDNIGTLQESAAEPTPDDIVNDSEDFVKPASMTTITAA